MSFNIWNCGVNVENGVLKIAKHIALVNPDIVALQEVEFEGCAKNITQYLPAHWTIVTPEREYPDANIITKHKVIDFVAPSDSASLYAQIEFPTGSRLNIWGVHAAYQAYGPYAAYNKMVTNLSQIITAEHWHKAGRAADIQTILSSPEMAEALKEEDKIPMIVAGDFNSPSHLDWTDETTSFHGGWAVPWPATKELIDFGFIDSFRALYPSPVEDPAYTWSTCNKFNSEYDFAIPEPQDRIDFIFYRGGLKPIRSQIYGGTEPIKPIPNHKQNDYPSDHFAVVTDFAFVKKPSKDLEVFV
ncbi:unnamed protein product, partial [Mesorhabditis belari]|uniref:Endonuclease/exonuclease/phosphatase domain-containing protein n=1 Tax=Mesorhabditis belari TaxID=2138241 RepID=A0AAF3EG96_9BILA